MINKFSKVLSFILLFAFVFSFSNIAEATSAWSEVGNGGASTGESEYTSLALDSDNIPYVAYRDETNGGKATVGPPPKFNTPNLYN